MEQVMVAIYEGAEPEEAAEQWINNNKDKVARWVEGAEKGNGEKVTLAYVAWDSEMPAPMWSAKCLRTSATRLI